MKHFVFIFLAAAHIAEQLLKIRLKLAEPVETTVDTLRHCDRYSCVNRKHMQPGAGSVLSHAVHFMEVRAGGAGWHGRASADCSDTRHTACGLSAGDECTSEIRGLHPGSLQEKKKEKRKNQAALLGNDF